MRVTITLIYDIRNTANMKDQYTIYFGAKVICIEFGIGVQ
jgi:hypothetical protein